MQNSKMEAMEQESKQFWSDESDADHSEDHSGPEEAITGIPDCTDNVSVVGDPLNQGCRKYPESEFGVCSDVGSTATTKFSHNESNRLSPRFQLKHDREVKIPDILEQKHSSELLPRKDCKTMEHSVKKARKNIFPSLHLDKSSQEVKDPTANVLCRRMSVTSDDVSDEESDSLMSDIIGLVSELPNNLISPSVETNFKNMEQGIQMSELRNENDIEDDFLSDDEHKKFDLFLPKSHYVSPNKMGNRTRNVTPPFRHGISTVESQQKNSDTKTMSFTDIKKKHLRDADANVEDEFLSEDSHRTFDLFLPKSNYPSPIKTGVQPINIPSVFKKRKSTAKKSKKFVSGFG